VTRLPVRGPGSDLHVHSTFSDDAESAQAENLAAAAARGLHTIGMVDHVRRSTAWVPDMVAGARALDGHAGVRVLVGVEAKVLDTAGAMDMPDDLADLDYVLVADHQMPRPDGPMTPSAVAAALADGLLGPGEVIDGLVEATVAAFGCWERVVVAHPFSILPKCGLGEDRVPDALVRRLGQEARAAGAAIEVNEKWTCPASRVARLLAATGCDLTFGTDAHHEDRVGRYSHVLDVAGGLAAAAIGQARPG
jgi:putative hydrolase